MTYRDEAKASRSGKVARVLNGANKSNVDSVMVSEGVRGTSPISRKVDNQTMKAEGKKSKERFDRPARARGGSVAARKAGGAVAPTSDFKAIAKRGRDGVEKSNAMFKEKIGRIFDPKNTSFRPRKAESTIPQSAIGGNAPVPRGGAAREADDTAKDFSAPDRSPWYRKNASGQMNYFEKGGTVKRARGGSVKKGKTNVTVIVAPQGGAGGAPGVSVASGPPPMMPPPAAPPMGGPPLGAIPPPSAGGMPPRPPMGPPQGMPMRKRGGAVKMEGGAGGGLGRLEKAGKA